MNKSKIILLIIVLLPSIIIAQVQNEKTNLASFSPPSPQAASLGRYGMIPNTSSSGQINYSVPIYEIPLRSSSWNVSLNYNYSGMMLEGKPSMTGLGWTLLGSGVINREVRGAKDEGRYGYFGDESKRSIIQDYLNTGDMSIEDRKRFKSGYWDSELDVYHVSAPGLSFSFKLDQFDNPIFLSNNAAKVLITRNTVFEGSSKLILNIKVIDTKGVVYEFSKKESSKPKDNEEFIDNYTDMSWLLAEVTYPDGDFVRFKYDQLDMYSYDYSAAGVAIYSNGFNPEILAKGYGDGTKESIIKTQVLKTIQFPTGNIQFINSNPADGRLLYAAVKVKDNFGAIINDYTLSYQGTRDLLVKVENKSEAYFDFEYYDEVIIPGFLTSTEDKALNKDRWGYYNYNGGASNTYGLNVPDTEYQANLTPSFRPTKSGALKKIIYPTGGFTEVTYQQNQIKKANVGGSDYYNDLGLDKEMLVELIPDYLVPLAPNYKETVSTLTIEYPTVAEISHKITGTREGSHIFMEIYPIDEEGNSVLNPNFREYYPTGMALPNFYQNYDILIPQLRNAVEQYTNGSPNTNLNPLTPYVIPVLVEEYGPDDGPAEPDNIVGTSGGRLVIQPGIYQIKIYTTMNRVTNATAEIRIKLQSGFLNPTPPPEFVNINVGGIRISKLKDCTSINGDCYERVFNYNDSDNLSTGKLANTPINEIIQTSSGLMANGAPFSKVQHYYSTEYYSALSPSFGTPVYYKSVTEKQIGDGVSNGQQVRNFTLPGDLINLAYPKLPNGRDLSGAQLAKTFVYKTKSDVNELVSKTTMKNRKFSPNTDDLPNYMYSIKVHAPLEKHLDYATYSYDENSINPEDIVEIKKLYPIKRYRELDYEFKPEESIQYSFFEDKIVVSGDITAYNYSNFLPNKISAVTGVENNVLFEGEGIWILDKTKQITYPIDIAIANRTVAEDDLIDDNRIAIPIKTEVYKVESTGENTLLFTKKVEHMKLDDGKIAPQYIKSSIGGNPLKNDIIFHSYDGFGNPREVSKLDNGMHTVYIWGYVGTKLIAKIENITYADLLESDVTVLENLSNTDVDNCLTNENCAEDEFRTALNALRNKANLQNALITTYTYDIGIGVTSQTDPNGNTIFYKYDNFSRLKLIRDNDGNIISKNIYQYADPSSLNQEDQTNYVYNYTPQVAISTENSVSSGSINQVLKTANYFDGLGRPIQTVSKMASPAKKDNVLPIEYDNFGRQPKNYLPYVSNESSGLFKPITTDNSTDAARVYGGSPHANFYQGINDNIANDTRPFSEAEFEASPLNRPIHQYGAGQDWKDNNRSTNFRYETNNATEVRVWRIEGDMPVSGAPLEFYGSGELYKNVTVDEQNHEVIEFVDKQGKTVLKRVQVNKIGQPEKWADTYYVYDDFGNLRFVLPPEAVANLNEIGY